MRKTLTRAGFQRELTALIAFGLSPRRRGMVRVEVDATTPLFETGLVDSMAILELIAFVEQATGRAIPARQVQMKHFGTIDRICAAFWRDEDEVSHANR